MNTFPAIFEQLTGSPPFPWQTALFELFINGKELPSAADIPTGLGKTSVVTIWLIALLTQPERIPRRLVYVVNRRTVVDQTTAEVTRLRAQLSRQPALIDKLRAFCAVPVDMPLALSTLRGQFADIREWCADPARPAVIVGTVDMIGSGLLFNRYTCGFKTRPHHAAFLGQDALLVHDEAHLEPAFQELLESVAQAQRVSPESKPIHILQLTATARGTTAPFTLTPADELDERVVERLKAGKQLRLTPIKDDKSELVPALIKSALNLRSSGCAVLIFARTVDAVKKVADELGKAKLPHEVLTGTMRGRERDGLIRKAAFVRFMPESSRPEDAEPAHPGTCYLVATSAGEVGVNISADDLICDLSTYESMAQRFGRVNRFGKVTASIIEVIHPESFNDKDDTETARSRTLDLLRKLQGDASPDALRKLDAQEKADAFSPQPTILPATDILFDAWSMTSIREPLPGRPPVAPYLHGVTQWEPPETEVAWREEVEVISSDLLAYYGPEDLLSEYPLKPHELLKDRSSRVRAELDAMLKARGKEAGETPIWLLRQDGSVEVTDLDTLADKDNEERLHDATVLLPPSLGGLTNQGTLDGTAKHDGSVPSLDVADIDDTRQRIRTDDREDIPSGWKVIVEIDTQIHIEDTSDNEPAEDDDTADDGGNSNARYRLWLERIQRTASDTTTSKEAVLLDKHVGDVVAHAKNIVHKLALSESLSHCVVLAAEIHDLGKRRTCWQRGIGNADSTRFYAKPGRCAETGRRLVPRPGAEPYRHEFGSLLDVDVPTRLQQQETRIQQAFAGLQAEEKDIVLHLVAAHHGRARPHFPLSPVDETFDPEADYSDTRRIATEVPQRFARLQRRFGRWGLAYLESLLRAADYAASAGIEPLPTNE